MNHSAKYNAKIAVPDDGPLSHCRFILGPVPIAIRRGDSMREDRFIEWCALTKWPDVVGHHREA